MRGDGYHGKSRQDAVGRAVGTPLWNPRPVIGMGGMSEDEGRYYLQLSRLLIEVNRQLDAHAEDRTSAAYANALEDLREAMSDSLTLAMLIAQRFKVEQTSEPHLH